MVAETVSSVVPFTIVPPRSQAHPLTSPRLYVYGQQIDSPFPGTSKEAIGTLRDAMPGGPFLVVCPLRIAEHWSFAIRSIEPGSNPHMITTATAWESRHRWTVVARHLIEPLEADLLAQPWAGVIVDDADGAEQPDQRPLRVLPRRSRAPAPPLPAGTRMFQPVVIVDKEVRVLEERAFRYLDRYPARGGPTWTTFLALVDQARRATALAKVPATISTVRERLRAGQRVVVLSVDPAVVDLVRATLGAVAVAVKTADTPEQRRGQVQRLARDPKVRVLVAEMEALIGLPSPSVAAHVICNDLGWNAADHRRVEDEFAACRCTRPPNVTYVTATGTLDDLIVAPLHQVEASNDEFAPWQLSDTSSRLAVIDAAVSERAYAPLTA